MQHGLLAMPESLACQLRSFSHPQSGHDLHGALTLLLTVKLAFDKVLLALPTVNVPLSVLGQYHP
jgi:hypothetical protein